MGISLKRIERKDVEKDKMYVLDGNLIKEN